MTCKKLIAGLTVAIIALGAIPITSQPSTAQQRASGSFFCGTSDGKPATMVQQPNRGGVAFIRWVRSFAPDSRWTPQERCKKVSQKFQENQKNGTLKYIAPGKSSENGLPVLCASQERSPKIITCPDQQILMTLRREDNAQDFIKKLVSLNTDVNQGVGFEHSGDILECHESVTEVINGRLECPDDVVLSIDVQKMITQLK